MMTTIQRVYKLLVNGALIRYNIERVLSQLHVPIEVPTYYAVDLP